MINNQMTELINKRKRLDANDHIAINDIWQKEIEVLSFSLENTIDFLKNTSEENLLWSSEVWEDISSIFKSEKLIVAMEEASARFLNIQEKLESCVKDARIIIDDK